MPKIEKKPEPLHLSWNDIIEDTKILVDMFHKKKLHFKSIVAISRGGLVPAALIAQLLHLHIVDTVCIKTYKDFRSKEGAGVLKPLYYPDGGEGVLVVDDLTDSGLTIMYLRKMLPKAHIAVLYAKPEGENLSDSYVKEVPQDTWLVFPWEVNSHHDDFMPDENVTREYELDE